MCGGARWEGLQPPSEHDRALFEKAALFKMETGLQGLHHNIASITTVAKAHKDLSDRRLLNHIECRRRVLMKFRGYMNEPGATLALPPPLLGTADQLSSYDLVFRTNHPKNSLLDATNAFCNGSDTCYGYGFR